MTVKTVTTATMTINQAIKTAKKECTNQYAQTYLQAIPEAIEQYGENGFDVQLLYAFSNMGTWRGETAREVKTAFKAYLKRKGKM